MEKKGMIAIILAAGEGKRMKSSIPKVLHQVCGKSLIRRSAELCGGLPLEKKIVVVSPQGEALEKELPAGFEFAVQEKPLGTAHAVLAARSFLKKWQGDVLILCADAPLLRLETLKKFVEKHEQDQYYGAILTGRLPNPTGYGRIVRGGNDEVISVVEEAHATVYEKAIEEINSGTYCFDWPALQDALNEIQIHPEKNELYLTDAIQILALQNKPISAYCVDDAHEIMGINSRAQLAQAEKVLRQRVLENLMYQGVTLIDPASTFIDETVEIGQDSVIHPFTVIEGEVKIGRSCEIGPFTHIRGGTNLSDRVEIGNFVEVKASQIGEGTKAKHLTYLGNAQVGPHVNVGAGTITANYDGEAKHTTQIDEGAFVGSGTIFVAPVQMGKRAVTGAGAVVTRGKNIPDGAVVVGVPAKILQQNSEVRKQK
ncbi:MAG: bifunctional N-acetylglucosamine-1-phosphate uridyltransferase/glucosamine-1-phosphate acetyltransferase [Chlamydiae bacterium]|nr:bifunctional N-acetylglucosamine-1-phosphate uridyltransferase/glucosamine-1-phosphate acetyltransferase [Chlamydiota bacterium]MBI3266190.1 bifunctional N-acetylglucosamine-1-phosphate uridyltransferase/glucosamine-1-phosphate acetyltransferase [Chlamydiota bacterium]